jgi:hypothetical protein
MGWRRGSGFGESGLHAVGDWEWGCGVEMGLRKSIGVVEYTGVGLGSGNNRAGDWELGWGVGIRLVRKWELGWGAETVCGWGIRMELEVGMGLGSGNLVGE